MEVLLVGEEVGVLAFEGRVFLRQNINVSLLLFKYLVQLVDVLQLLHDQSGLQERS